MEVDVEEDSCAVQWTVQGEPTKGAEQEYGSQSPVATILNKDLWAPYLVNPGKDLEMVVTKQGRYE